MSTFFIFIHSRNTYRQLHFVVILRIKLLHAFFMHKLDKYVQICKIMHVHVLLYS